MYRLSDAVDYALVRAQVASSERYVEVTTECESEGESSVIGWDKVCNSSQVPHAMVPD